MRRPVLYVDAYDIAKLLAELGGLAAVLLDRSPRWRAARAATRHTVFCWRSNYAAERNGQ